MPLSKARDRERKRLTKFQPNSNLREASTFQPSKSKIVELQRMIRDIETKVVTKQSEYIPWYIRGKHKQGDVVRMRDASGKVQVITVPELDAEGQRV